MRISAAKAMIECLKAEGVKVVFGYPGAAICPFYDELYSSGIEHVLVRHEANAGHAASGYARISGKPGVCIATSGPGAVNLITAIATAYADSIPMVIITGQVDSEQIGRDVFQEADITGAAEPFVKHSYLIKNPDVLAGCFKKAFYIAGSGRPGPVLIDVPMDVQNMYIEFSYPEKAELRSYRPNIVGNKLQIKRVIEALSESKRPLICAGGGLFASDACYDMCMLAEAGNIPVINTMMGLGSISTLHPLFFGMLGMHGKRIANYALQHCDLLILFGARVGDRAIMGLSLSNDMKVVHIDIDPAEIGKNLAVTIPVVGDVKTIIGQIMAELPEMFHQEWIDELNALHRKKTPELSSPEGCVNPKSFILCLNRLLPEKAVVVADVGQNQIWTANNIKIDGGRFLTSGGMGTMGYALPAAIGAKKAAPECETVAVCGDGGFQMSLMELATAVQHRVSVKIIVFVNNRLGMVSEVQERKYGGRFIAVSLDGSPDFIELAKAYGISGETVDDINGAEEAVKRMLDSEKPYILQVIVDKNEKTIID